MAAHTRQAVLKLHLIFARSANGVIGKDGALPWHLPEDMAHFKRTTVGHAVIMGRRTWDSLPSRFRPLPQRLNIVVTRQATWQATGAIVAHSLEEACRLCPAQGEAWVIGGAQMYAQALPLASTAVVTEIAAEFDGDAHAPEFGPEWQEVTRQDQVSGTGLKFSFVSYRRNSGV